MSEGGTASAASRCSCCGLRGSRLRRCPCLVAAYCNAECQQKHWDVHRRLCTTVRQDDVQKVKQASDDLSILKTAMTQLARISPEAAAEVLTGLVAPSPVLLDQAVRDVGKKMASLQGTGSLQQHHQQHLNLLLVQQQQQQLRTHVDPEAECVAHHNRRHRSHLLWSPSYKGLVCKPTYQCTKYQLPTTPSTSSRQSQSTLTGMTPEKLTPIQTTNSGLSSGTLDFPQPDFSELQDDDGGLLVSSIASAVLDE
eukprot:TRINITY_DN18040_c0_g1_i1.p1 TRINITY_DN18040_c0_g1~~TRINITY_DN18040_c0_g1_i1.p1  ORF type:complete len:264 (+),score=48.59 TRINITY_DN18040_c0_g1_i1:36-794(+)